jgi:peptidoglycan/xylan/chitin deacetylase (PgdA/CDA1 family)
VARLRRGEPLGGIAAITFDDGYRDNAAVVAPELKRRGLPATFFVATEMVGSDFVPSWDAKCGVPTQWMSWDEVRQLRRDGFEIGSHTMHHVDLGTASPAQARQELACSRERLERELGEPVTLFSYPFGRAENMNETNRALVQEAGYACCASANGGIVSARTDPYRLARISVTPWYRFPEQLGFDLLRSARS